jgi:hydroxylamine reductase
MFCYQCEQTAKGTGCTVQGVCGKQPEVAALQDLLLYTLMGLSQVAVEGRKHGVTDSDVNVFTVQASFSTLTNVDFDPDRFVKWINQADDFLSKERNSSLRLMEVIEKAVHGTV